ncbi:MAG: hypothetical protein H0W76_01290 [Pyrinomonadaceae bacterium]|nr:hypothetical protein [Pyrinomonadaceae bacterium]
MMYRPNFCAECGSRIERARWHPWTSRRFCAACGRRFGRARFTSLLLACVALSTVGYIAGRAGRVDTPPLVIERRAGGGSGLLPREVSQSLDGAPHGTKTFDAGDRGDSKPAVTENDFPTDPRETVSMCGARTQKGAPCSRRVRGAGRCWQHRGKSAMLPPEKLVVRG